jgi:hypothetical protein
MNILSSSLFILSLIQCSHSVPYGGDLGIFWQMPEGVTITSVRIPLHSILSMSSTYSQKFKTTLEVPLHMAATVYGNSIHAFSSYLSSSSSRMTNEITTHDGVDRTYNITMNGIGESKNNSKSPLSLLFPLFTYFIS